MPDLSKSFGRPASASRSALAGMLPARPASPPPPPVDEAPTQKQDELASQASSELAEAPAPPQRTQPPAPRSAATPPNESHVVRRQPAGRDIRLAPAAQGQSQTHQQVVYISSQAKHAAERRRRQSGCSNAEIVFDALDDAHEDLYELLAERLVITRSPESLFPARRAVKRASSPSSRRVSFTFRATEAELQVIRDLVRDFDAGSISEIVAVAMDHSLAKSRRRN